MSDVLDERKLRSERIVYGYIRTRIDTSIQIPNDIRKLCCKYYHIEELFDGNKMHKTIEITNNGSTVTLMSQDAPSAYRNVYGTIAMDSKVLKKYSWKLTIAASGPFIGFATNRDIKGDRKVFDYAYSSYSGNKYRYNVSDKYGASAAPGSSIIISIDFKKAEICFSVNGEDLGVAFKDIKIGPIYYLAISLFFEGKSVTIDEFKCVA